MNDVVWVALISSGGAVLAAVMTQFLGMKTAARQAARTERKEELQWLRSEASKTRDLRLDRLREFWSHILVTQERMMRAVSLRAHSQGPIDSAEKPPDRAAFSAAQAYCVALLYLPDVRDSAKEFYRATASAEMELLDSMTVDQGGGKSSTWRNAFDRLEVVVMEQSDELLMPTQLK